MSLVSNNLKNLKKKVELFVSTLGYHIKGEEVQPQSFLSSHLYEDETPGMCVSEIVKHYDMHKYLHKESN
jgi:hypothetical protein